MSIVENILNASLDGLPDVSHMQKRTMGQGFASGGVYHNPDNPDHQAYIKFYGDEQQARSEVAFAGIARHLKANPLDYQLVKHKGRVGVYSHFEPDLERITRSNHGAANWSDQQKKDLAHQYVAAAVMADGDRLGGEQFDGGNMGHLKGRIRAVDFGAAGRFTGMGFPKEYSKDVSSYATGLLDKSRLGGAGEIFQHLEPRHIKAALRDTPQLDALTAISHFKKAGVRDYAEMGATVVSRLNGLRKLYGL